MLYRGAISLPGALLWEGAKTQTAGRRWAWSLPPPGPAPAHPGISRWDRHSQQREMSLRSPGVFQLRQQGAVIRGGRILHFSDIQ